LARNSRTRKAGAASQRIALVTGGGRGIGANVARALAGDGWSVVVAARSREQIEDVAREIGGRAVQLDVASRESVERAVAKAGDVELLVANAGTTSRDSRTWETDPVEWWRTFEVNVLGVYLCCRAVIPGMIERGRGRIVITGSGSAYLPGSSNAAYSASKAAVWRFGEIVAAQLEPHGIAVFVISPGLVQTAMTRDFGDDMPWTPPELAPELVRKLATGRYDALAGRYLHAEHDDVDDLVARLDELRERDLNKIRLQR
jgi:NAD(P)-dependent dehydrogenase (short-subunit alcohol dehydrogenase family)